MLKKILVALTLSVIMVSEVLAANSRAIISTSFGEIEIALDNAKAPISVQNFLNYANSGTYDNTIFHRVISGFMIQGGGFTAVMAQIPTQAPIINEADNGLQNLRGTIAMARTSEKDSATSQFFINVADNTLLDHGQRDFGYAVFGVVTNGLDVVDKIAHVPTKNVGSYQNVPTDPIVIKSVKILP